MPSVGREYIQRQQPEREHVLRAAGVLARELGALERVQGQLGQVDGVHVVALERAVLERVARPPDAGQRPGREVAGVDDQRRALGQVAQVGLQRRRVHRHQHVRPVARGQDVVIGEVHLEGRDAGQRAGRGADLGREVRERREVVAEDRRLLREPVTRELHAVARVAGDTDDNLIQLFDVLGHAGRASAILGNPVILRTRAVAGRWAGSRVAGRSRWCRMGGPEGCRDSWRAGGFVRMVSVVMTSYLAGIRLVKHRRTRNTVPHHGAER